MRKTLTVSTLAALCLMLMAGGVWYVRDRAGLLSTLCKAGLPNYSLPPVLHESDLGCTILGPKRRVSGVLYTSFENARFEPDELSSDSRGQGDRSGTWYTPNQTAKRNAALDRQLGQRIPGVCTFMASVVVEGWTTVTPGRFGHLGMYGREFFEDRLLEVKPPPPTLVAQLRAQYAKASLGRICANGPI